jgi:hypothetical protein
LTAAAGATGVQSSRVSVIVQPGQDQELPLHGAGTSTQITSAGWRMLALDQVPGEVSGHAMKHDGAMHCRMSLVVMDGSGEGL